MNSTETTQERIDPLKTNFWRYFFKTLKKSSFLIINSGILAIYFILSAIFANKMDLDSLTFYNAMIAIGDFVLTFGYGIGLGVSLFINQNINNKEKKQAYIKLGLLLTFIFSLVFSAFLLIFKNNILESFIGIDAAENSNFYYYMIAFAFLNSIAYYLTVILTQQKYFVMTIITSVVFSLLIIIGFVILYFSSSLALDLIGLIFLIAIIMLVIVCYLIFLYHKNIKINLLKPQKFSIKKSVLRIILTFMSNAAVWSIGIIFLNYFLLKVNNNVYNAYFYFQETLYIFDIFYFAFASLISIEITRSLGEGKFDEAFKHSKYCILGSLVLWGFFAICSIIVSIPLINQINFELYSIAYISIALYLVIQLIRYFFWNFSSYILTCGGKVKLQFYLELASMIYFILLYIIADFIPDNIYLLYFLIVLDMIIKIPIEIIIFRRKKWMATLKPSRRNLNMIRKK